MLCESQTKNTLCTASIDLLAEVDVSSYLKTEVPNIVAGGKDGFSWLTVELMNNS